MSHMSHQGIPNPAYSIDDLGSSPSTPRPDIVRSGSIAVKVSKACKGYGSNRILKGLDMTVQQGTIYSLLGASGCGKTTLLSCIVGTRNLDSGSISVFGSAPCPGPHIGYMPQEYALYPEMTVLETLDYYALVYGMEGGRKKVRERSKFLIEFLQFPKGAEERRISFLSGGQKRRVSLAVAMLHEPKLLILDEPTVGVDHLLREKILGLLRDIVKDKGVTLIITTHYIEEARISDTMSFMRSGRLLCEQPPTSLLLKYDTNQLDDVILELSKADADTEMVNQNNYGVHEVVVYPPIPAGQRKGSKEFEKETGGKHFSLSRFRALVNKNFLLLLRNYIFLLFNFLTPALQIVVACMTMGIDPHHVKFGFINNEVPLYECMQSSMVHSGSCNPPAWWSCLFYDKISSYNNGSALDLIPIYDEEDAIARVESGELWGYLNIPENFSQALFERQLAGVNPTKEDILYSTITLRMDQSSDTVANLIKRLMLESFTSFSKDVLKLCDYEPEVAEPPLQIGEPVFGSKDTNYREFLAPALLLAILFFLPLTASGISYISDRKSGTLDRSLVAGVTSLEIMGSNTVSQMVVLAVQSILSFVIMTNVFDIKVAGNVGLALALCVLIGVAGMSMGFLISSIVEEEVQAVIIAIGTFFPNFALAGIVWPIVAMPTVLQYFSYLLPCSLASEAIRSIITRGLGFTHIKVWPGFISTLGWIIFYWGVTILIHRITSKRR